MLCGIYKITNLVNNKVYIGSSKNIDRRIIQHRQKLNKNKHYNSYLQRAWNKYGEDNFKFETVEIITTYNRNILKKLEQSYLDKLDYSYSYNICKYADGGETGPPICGEDHIMHRKILVYDSNMNFIEEIAGVRSAERKYNTHCVYLCCMGKNKESKGYIFKYKDDFREYQIKEKKVPRVGSIIYSDINFNKLGEYGSVSTASKALGLSREHIWRKLKSLNTRFTKYNFEYKNQPDGV